ncbi:Poly(3-hydroxyalkanoate) depolymerase C [Sulfitobacter noctilucicola]|uniref:Poly(Hydroxyalkanoate) depolymerase family esterase n=1 Tax=Sulfitobacter noctilucicola TaxID=1342301 RepID=A0A7W6MAN2_9RHOB|nr:PHB depolymerase family esterase [Sulfitobacter noctilucicola]KIN63754.1 Poly(3-hydroxyalkanoate) depolymerase C [Sulfitobacter noctilucicola]MBB4174737.1 poly(hydroxyalkanoate) depolymerase family esterase [Sulfitobacter noctilucicola]
MMIKNARALRRAMDNTRAGTLMDATALIQKTLGQHGLLPSNTDGIRPRRQGAQNAEKGAGRKRYSCRAGTREYLVHVPAGRAEGVLLMLHGCTQTPEDFATGTGIVNAAVGAGFAVVLPAQSRGDNAQSCWNWFSGADQKRGSGEPAILAGLTAGIAKAHGVPQAKCFVAGLSAGGAMAVILGETYPDVFGGVGVHSGLPYGCARGVNEAFAAMGGSATRRTAKSDGEMVPTIIFHGTSDATVKMSNGEQIVDDALNRVKGPQTQIVTEGTTAGRAFTAMTSLDARGRPVAEYWQIEGLGHAWSGGNAKGSYADPKGPDATAEMLRFFKSLSTSKV